MQETMKQALEAAFAPLTLELVNESAKHAGHAGHREAGGGDSTHFRLKIVSEAFAGKSRIERHRMVNAVMGNAWKGTLHALAIDAKAPGE